jgi:hypothetical protein
MHGMAKPSTGEKLTDCSSFQWNMWVCLKIVYPIVPMINDHYPILSLLNGYDWEYTLFSDKPTWNNQPGTNLFSDCWW